ncbi:MAG: hypothetical protein ACQESJ_06660 [Bacteroidota bacterium]
MKNQKQHIDINKISKELPFRVPDNYFEELPEKIQARCKEAEQTEQSGNSLINILKPAFSLAAMFIGVALLAFFAVNVISNSGQEKTSLSEDMAKANYEEQYSSEEEMIKAIQEQEENIKMNSEEANEYIDYLLEDDIDYGTLIKELEEDEKDPSSNK